MWVKRPNNKWHLIERRFVHRAAPRKKHMMGVSRCNRRFVLSVPRGCIFARTVFFALRVTSRRPKEGVCKICRGTGKDGV